MRVCVCNKKNLSKVITSNAGGINQPPMTEYNRKIAMTQNFKKGVESISLVYVLPTS